MAKKSIEKQIAASEIKAHETIYQVFNNFDLIEKSIKFVLDHSEDCGDEYCDNLEDQLRLLEIARSAMLLLRKSH